MSQVLKLFFNRKKTTEEIPTRVSKEQNKKRSRYLRQFKDLNDARSEHSIEIVQIQKQITEYKQKLEMYEDKLKKNKALFDSKTDMIRKLEVDAANDDIQLSSEEIWTKSQEITIDLTNLKNEHVVDEN